MAGPDREINVLLIRLIPMAREEIVFLYWDQFQEADSILRAVLAAVVRFCSFLSGFYQHFCLKQYFMFLLC